MDEHASGNNLPDVKTPDFWMISSEQLGMVVSEMMRPLAVALADALKNNTAALEQIAATQSIQNERMAALEKQIRLQTPVTPRQVTYLNDAIRARACELLNAEGVRDGLATKRLGNAIRKAVLMRYGISGLREVPKHEYSVALSQIGLWNDAMTVWDVAKEAKDRAEMALAAVEPAAGLDGNAPDEGQAD